MLRGMAVAEALRVSASSCMSRSVIAMSQIGPFGSGLSSRRSLYGIDCEVVEGWAGLQRHPDDLAVVDLGKYHPQVCPESPCLVCNGFSGFTVATEWCHRSRILPDPSVEDERHFINGWYLCLPRRPLGQHHIEHIVRKLVGVEVVVEWSPRVGHRRRSSDCVGGLRCWSVCQLQVLNSSRDGVLAPWHYVSRLVNERSACGGFFFQRVIPFVLDCPWVLRLAQTHSTLAYPPSVALAVSLRTRVNVSDPCLRQRGLALELTNDGANDMWKERGRERWRRQNQVMGVDKVTSRCMVVENFCIRRSRRIRVLLCVPKPIRTILGVFGIN